MFFTKKKTITLTLSLALTLLAGCSTKWMTTDGAQATPDKIREAKQKCQVDEKIYQLSYSKTSMQAASNYADGEARKQLKANYEAKEAATYAAIDTCMKEAGLEKKK